ncbi:MAG: hypothetical protein Q8R47_02970 [Nanoarchaeota archaeon]|nr:hypothetical protein [Nanoarchaeota archaeon]
MYSEIEAGYCIQEIPDKNLGSIVIEYFADTVTCVDKLRFWKEIDFKKKFAAECGIKPEDVGMVKTMLFSYLQEGREHYFLASTLAEKQIDYHELRVELGLSGAEAQSINRTLSDSTIEAVLGKKRGAVSPLLIPEYLQKLDAIYFTRDLMDDAAQFPGKKYDLPRSVTVSEFWNAATLFNLLQQKSPRYKRSGSFEKEMGIATWKVKKIDQEKAGYSYLFGGTTITYRGQEYQLTNPPMKREGVDRKRKQIMCTAFPISQTAEWKIQYEYTDQGKKRVLLPITYEHLEQLLPP